MVGRRRCARRCLHRPGQPRDRAPEGGTVGHAVDGVVAGDRAVAGAAAAPSPAVAMNAVAMSPAVDVAAPSVPGPVAALRQRLGVAAGTLGLPGDLDPDPVVATSQLYGSLV